MFLYFTVHTEEGGNLVRLRHKQVSVPNFPHAAALSHCSSFISIISNWWFSIKCTFQTKSLHVDVKCLHLIFVLTLRIESFLAMPSGGVVCGFVFVFAFVVLMFLLFLLLHIKSLCQVALSYRCLGSLGTSLSSALPAKFHIFTPPQHFSKLPRDFLIIFFWRGTAPEQKLGQENYIFGGR